MEHVSSCQVSIDNGSTDNIHVLIVQYGLRVEIKESQKKKEEEVSSHIYESYFDT